MPDVTPGLRGELTWTVEEPLCTKRGDHLIFSTPSMVQLLESASIEALRPCLDPKQASVGTRVDIRHLAPTVQGMTVRAVVTVREVDRRRVAFDVEVFDDVEKVGEADHERFIVDLDRYMQRLEQKVASWGATA
jgi:fluoroacetyl-CoA thioesterase